MENQNYPSWKHALTYGLYLGVALIILSLVFYIAEFHGAKWTTYVNYVFILGGVTISAIVYRNKHLSGFITYGQSFSTGFLTGLFAAIISAIFTFVFMLYLGEEYVELLMEIAEEEILRERPDIGDEEFDLAMNWTRKIMNPTWLSIMVFLSTTFFSLVFSLIASIFIKKEETLSKETE